MNIYTEEAKKLLKGKELTPELIKSLNYAEKVFVGEGSKPDPKWVAETAIIITGIFTW